MDSRQQFEEWQKGKYCGGEERLKRCSNADDVYYFQEVQLKWVAWQASRESLVVALDPPHNDYEKYTDREVSGACKYYEQAKKHIHEAGIRTK